MKKVKEKLYSLNESPDNLKLNGNRYDANHESAYSFEVILDTDSNRVKDVIIASESGRNHGDDENTDGEMEGGPQSWVNYEDTLPRYNFNWKKIYPGRIFLEPKILSFWVYPSKAELKTIISIFEKKMNISITDNGWFIEVYREGMKKKGKKDYHCNYDREDASEILPLEYYTGSNTPSEKEVLQHLDTKTKHKVPYGYGSRNPAYLNKRQWQMASLTDEGLKEDEFPRLFERKDKK
jgi:hypothetical protein